MEIKIGDKLEVLQQRITIGDLSKLKPSDPVPVAEEMWVPVTVTTLSDYVIGVIFADGTTVALQRSSDNLPFGHRKTWRRVDGATE